MPSKKSYLTFVFLSFRDLIPIKIVITSILTKKAERDSTLPLLSLIEISKTSEKITKPILPKQRATIPIDFL